jgi:hypothetical protein
MLSAGQDMASVLPSAERWFRARNLIRLHEWHRQQFRVRFEPAVKGRRAFGDQREAAGAFLIRVSPGCCAGSIWRRSREAGRVKALVPKSGRTAGSVFRCGWWS